MVFGHRLAQLQIAPYSLRVTYQQGNQMPFNPGFGQPQQPIQPGPPATAGGYGAAPVPTPGSLPGLAPGNGLLKVNLQGSVMTSSMIVPKVLLNGYLVSAQYGQNIYQVPAGQQHLEFYAQWMRQYGQAQIDVSVPLGGVAEVFYAAPLHQFATGNVGYVKQSPKGVLFMVAVLAVVMVVLVVGLALTVLN